MRLIMSHSIRTVAIIGSGVIGSGWAARCLAHGLDVIAFDPAPDGEAKIRAAIANAWPALETKGLAAGASQTRLTYVKSVADAVKNADFVQENAPEREELKQNLLAEIDSHAKPGVVIASSTSYLLPTSLQSKCANPNRIVVGHPFNPVYLLPLVEIVAGEKTSTTSVEAAKTFYRAIGMRPLHVRKEIEGFIADRLMEALWREALVADGYVSNLPTRGRRQRYAALHAPVRACAQNALLLYARAGIDGHDYRQDRRGNRASGSGALGEGTGTAARCIPQ
jgi:carnitine 3-dehydrogenase